MALMQESKTEFILSGIDWAAVAKAANVSVERWTPDELRAPLWSVTLPYYSIRHILSTYLTGTEEFKSFARSVVNVMTVITYPVEPNDELFRMTEYTQGRERNYRLFTAHIVSPAARYITPLYPWHNSSNAHYSPLPIGKLTTVWRSNGSLRVVVSRSRSSLTQLRTIPQGRALVIGKDED